MLEKNLALSQASGGEREGVEFYIPSRHLTVGGQVSSETDLN